MKLLMTSDVHCRFDRCAPATLPDADVLLVAGDLTNFGMQHYPVNQEALQAAVWLNACAERFAHVLWIPGNHDIGIRDTLPNLRPNCQSVLRRVVEIDGLRFYGESLACCFDKPQLATDWDWTTADPMRDLAAWENAPPADVIVSHSPPLGCCDGTAPIYVPEQGWNSISLGSPGLRAYIERHSPRLVVCGHVHEAVGEGRIGRTLVMNVAQRVDLLDMEQLK